MRTWGWKPGRSRGLWRYGSPGLKPLAALSPWLSVAVCLLTLYVVGDSLTLARGILFDLPATASEDGAETSLVAMVLPLRNETTVFFDDACYALRDRQSAAAFGERLAERLARSPQKTILILADRRICHGDLAQLASLARSGGADRILFANKRSEARDE